ncbi:MAG: T9SS type A sorting domain-containing protein [Bacteroidota bacterium]
MKNLNTLFSIVTTSISCFSFGQISLQHPNDIGIGSNSAVVFSEMFEQDSIQEMIQSVGYQTSQMQSHINFDASIPLGSLGSQSLKLTTVENSTVSNDPSEDANILKKFSNGITDSVFVRYYVKYNSNFTFHHSGVWMGGTNPANQCWPCNTPGRTIPTSGDSAFVIGTEIRGLANQSPQTSSKFGFYNYWMDMKGFTSGSSAGQYFGNEFISPSSNGSLTMDVWNCIEVMIKMNNPTNSTGELKLWINGQLVGHYGQGFPNGTWNQATFVEGVGAPFDGFRFRSNPAVVFNYIWLKNYSTNNTSTANNDVLYDHVVVAKDYIGPIYNPTNKVDELKNKTFSLYPNPVNETLNFSEYLEEFAIKNALGQEILQGKGISVSIEVLENGIYYLQFRNNLYKFIVQK